MNNSNNRIMYDCFTSSHSVYFVEAVDLDFREQYKGVVVNAHNDSGYGHFAIRKPITFWFKLPKFIKHMFPYRWIMYKNEKEKMDSLCFDDQFKAIIIDGDIKNKSYRNLFFDKKTYEDLKACIPAFLEHVGYKFRIEKDYNVTTIIFE